jgi:hypothetical protein
MDDDDSVGRARPAGSSDDRLERAWVQIRQERERCRRLADRVDALEAELTAMRASTAYRITYPLRRFASAIPPSVYAALRGGRLRLHLPAPRVAPVLVGDRPWALVVDDHFPEPDRDSGSIDIVNMVAALRALGFSVLFAARRDHAAGPSRRTLLEQMRVRTLSAQDTEDVETFLRDEGLSLALVVLNRLYCGGEAFETVRLHAPQAAVLFNTVDLHWVRLKREAALSGDPALAQAAVRARTRELQLAREADAVIVVSSSEVELLGREAPEAFAVELPLARPIVPPINAYAARTGIGFIGGFKHLPNLDALRWFVSEVWPLVLDVLPECHFSVVGPDLPADSLVGVPGRIETLGHVPDVGPWFESIRLSVAPIRFGAGAKGKVASSLAAGVPCVGTSIALEGMRLDAGVIAADDPVGMVRLHEDPALWARTSEAALAAARERFSLEHWQERVAATLATLGALPQGPTGDDMPGPA